MLIYCTFFPLLFTIGTSRKASSSWYGKHEGPVYWPVAIVSKSVTLGISIFIFGVLEGTDERTSSLVLALPLNLFCRTYFWGVIERTG